MTAACRRGICAARVSAAFSGHAGRTRQESTTPKQELNTQFNAPESKAPGSTRIMTTESTQPQPEQGPAPDNGQVQSQGHRRRRRRRKNKSSQQAAMQAQPAQGSRRRSRPRAAASRAAKAGPSAPGPEEEEVLPEKQAPAAQPGNSISAPPQGKRKGRQKGPRDICRPHGPQLSRRERQRSRRPALHHSDLGQRPRRRYYPEAYRRRRRRRSAKTRPRASSVSSRISSSWPRFRRPRASWA